MRICILGVSVLFAAACGGSDNNTTCGAGTHLSGDACEPDDLGSATTCGTGTHLDGSMCVPDAPAAAGAPTITNITPDHAGVTGNILFEITGTNFAGDGVNSVEVYFGPEDADGTCKAEIGSATATTITGEVPPFCDFNVQVEVKTNLGMATTPFHYDGLFAADGRNGGGGPTGHLYLIDPYASLYYDLGPLQDTDMTGYGITGLAFDAAGTLYGLTTRDPRHLVTIDPITATVTIVGDTVDAAAHPCFLGDLKFSGTTLYGYGACLTDDTDPQNPVYAISLMTVDPATGVVTQVGSTDIGDGGGGMAFDANGNLFVSTDYSAASPNFPDGTTGHLWSIDTTTGAATAAGTLDYPIAVSINSMASFAGTVVGAVTDGQAAQGGFSGVTLVTIETTTDSNAGTTAGHVTPLFELPAQLGRQSQVDALATPPAAFNFISRVAHDRSRWMALKPATPSTTVAAKATTCSNSVAIQGGNTSTVAPIRSQRLALSTLVSGSLSVSTCNGGLLSIGSADAAHYALMTNRKGRVKLIDTATGRTVLRNVTSITRN
jgi:hypothetical protein